jgi:hypothetical protein
LETLEFDFLDKVDDSGSRRGPWPPMRHALGWLGLSIDIQGQGMPTDRVQLDFGFKLADVAVTNRAEKT